MIVAALSEGMTGTLFGNDVLFWGLVSCLTAQLFKVFVELVVLGRWNPAVLFESGGMPSSHSALVTGSSACIGWSCGFDSPLFCGCRDVLFHRDVRRQWDTTQCRIDC